MRQLDEHGSEYVGASPPLPWPDADTGPWTLTLHWADVDGLTECVGVDVRAFIEERDSRGQIVSRRTVQGAKAEPITAREFRQINVGSVVRDERQRMWAALRDAPGETVASAFVEALGLDPEVLRHPGDQRRGWSSKDLSTVAAVYLEALDQKHPPRKAVAEVFDVSSSMASKLIRQARDAGLLGESPGPGKAGGATRKGDR
jgi:hypothetical protein